MTIAKGTIRIARATSFGPFTRSVICLLVPQSELVIPQLLAQQNQHGYNFFLPIYPSLCCNLSVCQSYQILFYTASLCGFHCYMLLPCLFELGVTLTGHALPVPHPARKVLMPEGSVR
jgi:hypothetical protein